MGQIAALNVFAPNTVISSASTNSNNTSIRNAYNVHDAASSGQHGVVGTFVGTSDNQTLTLKEVHMDADSSISATNKLYLDGDGAGTLGNTSIRESSGDVITMETNGIDHFQIGTSFARVLGALDFSIPATQKLYLDGGGDTYIYESAANVVKHVVGTNNILELTASRVICAPGISLTVGATNKFYLDGGGDTSIREISADAIAFEVGGNDHMQLDSAGELLLANVDPPTANWANRNGIVKGWVYYTNGAPGSISISYNVDSVTDDDGDGIFNIVWDTDFTGNYQTIDGSAAGSSVLNISGVSNSQATIITRDSASGVAGDVSFSLSSMGDQ